MRYRFSVTITDVFERKLQKHISGAKEDAIFETASAGWYVQINNTFSVYLGMEKPLIEKGEKCELRLIRL